jgi:diguanylate cyclase (GGDEF)-like protein
VSTRGLALRYGLWVLALLVPVLGVPALYYHHAADGVSARAGDRAAIAAARATTTESTRRAGDLSRAAAMLLATPGAADPGEVRRLLTELLPDTATTGYRVQTVDGRPILLVDPPGGEIAAGTALIDGGPLAGGRVDVFVADRATASRTVDADQFRAATYAELSELLRRASLIALAALVLMALFAWIPLNRSALALRRAMGKLRSIGPTDEPGRARDGSLAQLRRAVDGAEQTVRDLAVSRSFLDHVLDSIRDAVLVSSPGGEIRRANEAACRLLGQPADALAGRDLRTLTASGGDGFFAADGSFAATGEALVSTSRGVAAVEFRSAPLRTDTDDTVGQVLVLKDQSDETRSRERIKYLTRYDALTRVANRIQFQHKLQQAIARAHRNDVAVALLYVDIDHFKDVNDTFGHPVGDRALEITARRLVDALEQGTLVGRLAGDEFAVLLRDLPASEDMRPALAATARTLLDRIAREFYVERREIVITASIGIAACPDDADNVIDLIRNADAAMYHAKQSGGNTYGFYSKAMNEDAVDRLMLKNELRRAMDKGEFEVVYQPKIDLREGRVAGAEALLRWRHPQRGEVPPAIFIPLAEDSSLICEIGEWVLDRVCADFVRWQTRLAWPGRVAVNLSLGQLRQRDFVARIEQTFDKHRLTPSCIELEITESTLMHDGEKTLRMLDRLYQLGLHLSIDDFGTGYSSLSALQDFPIGTLKIDRSFVQGAARAAERGAIVTTIISMGQSLKMDVVAEGVETEEQLEFLRRQGCTYAQGHLFGPPLKGDDYQALLVEQQRGARPLEALFNQG